MGLTRDGRTARARKRGLVLTRKVGEEMLLDLPNGETIVVTVVNIRGTRVRLHTAASPEIGVRRPESPLQPAA